MDHRGVIWVGFAEIDGYSLIGLAWEDNWYENLHYMELDIITTLQLVNDMQI